MKHYTFKVILTGMGNSADEAWNDATEQFAQDSGPTPEEEDILSVEEESEE